MRTGALPVGKVAPVRMPAEAPGQGGDAPSKRALRRQAKWAEQRRREEQRQQKVRRKETIYVSWALNSMGSRCYCINFDEVLINVNRFWWILIDVDRISLIFNKFQWISKRTATTTSMPVIGNVVGAHCAKHACMHAYYTFMLCMHAWYACMHAQYACMHACMHACYA